MATPVLFDDERPTPLGRLGSRARLRVALTCGGERHHILCTRGRIVLENHDVPVERALGALGGRPPECLEVLALVRTGLAGWLIEPHRASVALPHPLVSWLRPAAARAITRRWALPDFRAQARPAVRAELRRRLDAALRRALDDLLGTASRPLAVHTEAEVVDDGDPVHFRATVVGDRVEVTAHLRLAWLTDLDLRGSTMSRERLVVEAVPGARSVVEWDDDGAGRWSSRIVVEPAT